VITTYREAEASMARFQGLMNIKKELIPENVRHLDKFASLEFRNVSFSYLNAKNYAVENLSFIAQRGETIAFVGPSGSGKTSVVKLLVGLYPPTKGELLYNGIYSTELDPNDLRRQIGLVTQDTQLFAGTIRENLLFVNPEATDAELLEALHKSAANSLLARAEKGIDTIIGEGGVKISGGEKQRLSIARALLRKPTLLVFDEATSSLDSLTEQEITKTIQSVALSKEHLTVLVAHRLSTIMHANRIYVLEKGLVVEAGTHSELVDKKGLYYAMWRQQIGERV
jgi:ATP-binding cassette subfamily B protein